jgi:hypothetical protein
LSPTEARLHVRSAVEFTTKKVNVNTLIATSASPSPQKTLDLCSDVNKDENGNRIPIPARLLPPIPVMNKEAKERIAIMLQHGCQCFICRGDTAAIRYRTISLVTESRVLQVP